MDKSTFEITQMDCPSEESLIRMKLDTIEGIKMLEFNIPDRKLIVIHDGNLAEIENAINNLKLGDKLISSEKVEGVKIQEDKNQSKLLWTVLIINFAFFSIEIITGWFSKSMGLVADSLDMLADSIVYGLSLFAVGKSAISKKKVASLAGYFQILLAVIGFIEVIRRFFGSEALPNFSTMILVSIFALVANALCLLLLQKSKSNHEAHMKASMIFTSNDIIINLGVIVAGLCVMLLNSGIPDLIIGSIVFILVIKGALKILQLGK